MSVKAGLHGEASRQRIANPLNTKDIHNILGIPGYKLILPSSWQAHGQARLLVIAREELQVKIRDQGVQNSDLPTLTCEISLARERKTVVNFFYREFTGGVSGLADMPAQVERLARQAAHWQSLCAGSKDVICLGDANLCTKRWNDENFAQMELADLIHNFLLKTSCC